VELVFTAHTEGHTPFFARDVFSGTLLLFQAFGCAAYKLINFDVSSFDDTSRVAIHAAPRNIVYVW
jgi:hypothetical protein